MTGTQGPPSLGDYAEESRLIGRAWRPAAAAQPPPTTPVELEATSENPTDYVPRKVKPGPARADTSYIGGAPIPDGTCDILLRAIARNAAIVLSLPSEGSLQHRRSRFISNGTAGFWVEAPDGDELLVDNLLRSALPVGVSFTSGLHRVMFATPLQRREMKRINLTMRVPALRMAYPAETIRRRTQASARVPAGADVRVRVWQIDERAPLDARPKPPAEIACDLRDIGVAGIGLTFYGRGGDPPRVSSEGRLRVELSHPGGMLLVEGRVRHLSLAAGANSARGRVEFAAPRPDQDGGRTLEQLARIVADLQRQEQRPPRPAVCRLA